MISQIHPDSSIGLKKLTDADLGIGTSHQTHIGLFGETFNFIDDNHESISSQLIYSNNSYEVLAFFDYIKNPDGTYRSPKIRKGSERELIVDGVEINSVVRELRDVIYKTDTRKNWYLIWYVNEDEHLVFVLFEFRSKLFDLLSSKLGGIGSRHQFDSNSVNYDRVINCLKSVIKIN